MLLLFKELRLTLLNSIHIAILLIQPLNFLQLRIHLEPQLLEIIELFEFPFLLKLFGFLFFVS